jgi:transcriptional regulator with PAS, ATPase and Fis domain
MERKIVIQLHSLLETRDNPTVLIDSNYRIVAANKAYCSSYGVPQNQIIGKACHEVSHRSSVPCHQNGEHCPHQHVFATSSPCEVLHTHYDFENKPDHVRINAHPIHDAGGQLFLMESIHRLAPKLDINCEEMRMAGKSPAFLKFFDNLALAAKSVSSVWLFGESGVGKELAARFLHEHSSRAKKPYVEINCAALPESLCESEMFGHEKGAFTGSLRAKRGLFELADGGTLFLDEIGDLPLSMQGKLLRVLDKGEFRRLGSETTLKCDVRIISATNRDLAQMVKDGSFRQDLFFRIAGFKVVIPPLRERREDIPAISELILSHLSRDAGLIYKLTRDALKKLLDYDYPGNIRELKSVLIKATAQCKHGVIHADEISYDHLPGCGCTQDTPTQAVGGPISSEAKSPAAATDLSVKPSVNYGRRKTDIPGNPQPVANSGAAGQFTRRNSDKPAAREERTDNNLASIEKQEILKLLGLYDNRRIVADKLGISERTLYRKLKKYGLEKITA